MRIHNRRLMLGALGLAVILVAMDFVIKNLIIQFIPLHSTVTLIPGLLNLTYVTNDSAAFSLGFGLTPVFALISFLAMLGLIWFSTSVETFGWAVITGVALGGVVGNLVDRIIREPYWGSGHVVDYLQMPLQFPVFNLADSLIVCVAITVVIRILRGDRIGKAGKASSDRH